MELKTVKMVQRNKMQVILFRQGENGSATLLTEGRRMWFGTCGLVMLEMTRAEAKSLAEEIYDELEKPLEEDE